MYEDLVESMNFLTINSNTLPSNPFPPPMVRIRSTKSSPQATPSPSFKPKFCLCVNDGSDQPVKPSILFDPSLSFTTGGRIVEVIVSEGGSNRTSECGTFSTPCGSIAIGWKSGTEGGSDEVFVHIYKSARFGDQIGVGQKRLEMRGLLEGKSRVVVDDDLPLEGKEEGVVVVTGGSVHLMELTMCLRRPSLIGEKKAGYVVSGNGECVFDGVKVVESWEGEGVGMGMVLWSGGSLKLTKIEMKCGDSRRGTCDILVNTGIVSI
ncbi:hypothetical protein BLNAU_8360 [Blattamonas nauphoetae]|uniref:Uncharacterized protein n=1 Tax=Blattamonas nauphoetae TaxID=2049346 RepID=A0ABQ9XZ21_9EUKA|nr:hypothetical protein BLNAU_8360 [Blattamonas nauphoetae]